MSYGDARPVVSSIFIAQSGAGLRARVAPMSLG
jgi:hypothetical protein